MKYSYTTISFILTFLATVATTWILQRARSNSRHLFEALQDEIWNSDNISQPRFESKQSFDEFPVIVQEYLKSVISGATDDTNSTTKIGFQQTGTFLLSNNWVPFNANQSLSEKGFFWHANMAMVPHDWKRLIDVVDACTPTQSIMRASLWGSFPFVYMQTNEPLSELAIGACMRWMAEAVLLPTLLASGEFVQWQGVDSTKALMVSPIVGEGKPIAVTFDIETKLPISVEAMRPKAVENGFIFAPWKGNLGNYVEMNEMTIPTYMEAGWIENGDLMLYFKADLHDFVFA